MVAVFLVLLGPLAGLIAYSVERSVEEKQALARFKESFNERVFALEKELASQVECVGAVQALFDSGRDVTRDEFQAFARHLLARHRIIKALEWVPRVKGPERERHEAHTQATGLDSYRITELLGSGGVVPSAERDEYYPVQFVEPLEGNTPALGLDLASDEIRKAALALAFETGEPALTDPIKLVQDTESSVGLLLFFPVYHTVVVSNQTDQPVLKGFAIGVIRVKELMNESLFAGEKRTAVPMDFKLIDDDVGGASLVMYSGPAVQENDAVGIAWQREAIEVGGQRWQLIGRPSREYLAQQHSSTPITLGIGAFLGWECLAVLGITLVNGSRNEARMDRARFIRSVLDSLSEGVIVADASGAFKYVNQAAKQMVETQRGNIPSSEWAEEFGLYDANTEKSLSEDALPLVRAINGEMVKEMEVFVRNPRIPTGAWVSVNGSPLKDKQNTVIGGVVVFRNISEQKTAEELSRRLASAVEKTADAVFITDRDGVIEYANEAFETITGYSRVEALGQTPRILKSGNQHPDYYTKLWASLLNGETFMASVINRQKNGELFHAQQTITPLRDSRGGQITHFVSVLRDMTEQMKIEEQATEMRLASKVQRRTFPQEPPRVPGFDIAGIVSPALQTCGDYYDFIPLPDGKWGIAIADACGHGVGPALIMAETRALLRALVRSSRNPAEVFAEVNELLLGDLAKGHYVTMILAHLDPQSGELIWANAGHPSGFVLDTIGSIKMELKSTGVPLGLFPSRDYSLGQSVVLKPGEAMLLLTDGIAETKSPDGSDLNATAIIDLVRKYSHAPAKEILERLHRFANDFAAGQPQTDDLTSVLCKRKFEATEPACSSKESRRRVLST